MALLKSQPRFDMCKEPNQSALSAVLRMSPGTGGECEGSQPEVADRVAPSCSHLLVNKGVTREGDQHRRGLHNKSAQSEKGNPCVLSECMPKPHPRRAPCLLPYVVGAGGVDFKGGGAGHRQGPVSLTATDCPTRVGPFCYRQ